MIAALDRPCSGAVRLLGRGPARAEPDTIAVTARPRAAPTPGARRGSPHRLRLGHPRPAGARAGGGHGRIEPDHRHPAPAGAARAPRRPRHDRRHRHAGRIATAILRRRSDYLLALKENGPATFGRFEAFFADPPPGSLDTLQTIDSNHGRIEVRRHAVCHDVAWLFSAPALPAQVAFPGLDARHGRERDRARRQGRAGTAPLSLPPPRSTRLSFAARTADFGIETGCTGSRCRLPR